MTEQEAVRIPRRGFVWHELMSTDPKQSEHFYQRVAGVSVIPLGDDPGSYQMLMVSGRPVGGIAGPRPDQEGWPSGGPMRTGSPTSVRTTSMGPFVPLRNSAARPCCHPSMFRVWGVLPSSATHRVPLSASRLRVIGIESLDDDPDLY
jgi:hypothetical protein